MMMSIGDIVDILEIEEAQVLLWCKAGILPALEDGDSYQISEDDFSDWQSSDAVMALLADMNQVDEDPEMESLDEIDL